MSEKTMTMAQRERLQELRGQVLELKRHAEDPTLTTAELMTLFWKIADLIVFIEWFRFKVWLRGIF